MKYKAGQFVINSKLGLGKVLDVRGDNLTVFFRDQAENPRTINVAFMPMELAKEEFDPDQCPKPATRRKRKVTEK